MALPQALDTARIILSRLVRGDIDGIKRLARVNTLFDPDKIVWNFSHLDELFDTVPLPAPVKPASALPENHGPIRESFTIAGAPRTLDQHIKERNLKAFLVLQGGAIKTERYFQGTQPSDRHISWSMSKSITSMLLGALIDKGIIPADALDYQLVDHLPALKGSGYDGASLRHVLHMSSGVAFNEDYLDYHSDINRLGRVIGTGGSTDEFAATLTREWAPGTYMRYVSVDTHVLGMMIRALAGRPMIELLSDHLFTPMGLEYPGFFLTDQTGEPFVLGGLNISTRDFARFGMMMLREGAWNDRQILSADWIAQSTAKNAPPPSPYVDGTPDAEMGYGMQWWRPPAAQEGEFFGIGIYGQYIYVNRLHDTVIVQNAADTGFREGEGRINVETLAMFRQIAEW